MLPLMSYVSKAHRKRGKGVREGAIQLWEGERREATSLCFVDIV